MAVSRPNILLITTDTQRCDSLGCMGSPFAQSPNLDKLASQGVTFQQAHTTSPVCGPARSSLITELYPFVHGAIENGFNRNSGHPTLPDALKAAGYYNAMVGKMHFDPIPVSFDEVTETNKAAYLKRRKNMGDLAPWPLMPDEVSPTHVPAAELPDSLLADKAVKVLAERLRQEQPLFLFASFDAPHDPMFAPREFWERFADVELPPVNYIAGEEANWSTSIRADLNLGYSRDQYFKGGVLDHDFVAKRRRLYYAFCAYIDEQIGRLIDTVDASGQRENTLIIFSSDHGICLYDHGHYDKHTFYDESWRVPLVFSQPGSLPEGTIASYANWNDITVSIAAAAGAAVPAMQGLDAYTPLTAGKPSPRNHSAGNVWNTLALVCDRWKITYDPQHAEGFLWDRGNDPQEQKNLWNDPSARDVRDHLLQGLLTWRAGSVDLHTIKESQGPGGPIANHAQASFAKRTGADMEQYLNRVVSGLPG